MTVVSADGPGLEVTPSALNFGTVSPGGHSDLSFTMTNTGYGEVDVDVPATCGVFSVIAGGGRYTLAMGEARVVTVRFAPQSTDYAACQLDLGTALHGPVPLTGNPCTTVTIPGGTTISAGNTQYDHRDVVMSSKTVTIAGNHTFCSLSMTGSSVLTHAAGDTGGVNLTILGNATINSSAKVSAEGKGYASSTGPGEGGDQIDGGGGGHGGNGGWTQTSGGRLTYGSVTEPVTLGSGGGRDVNSGYDGGKGGGAIRLIVGGELRVDGGLRATAWTAPGWTQEAARGEASG
ncbi:MAG: hypothetical protein IPK72_11455 [Candidatus Eisenbacteria bacterium]|nr:hypothetical protein [Candidatus Eisenbacteria bacterium]